MANEQAGWQVGSRGRSARRRPQAGSLRVTARRVAENIHFPNGMVITHGNLMDLGAQPPVRDVLQRHGHREKPGLVIGVG